MADLKDIILTKYQEERNWARHHENQRAMVTNVIIAIAAATIAFFGKSQFNFAGALFLIVIGLFGMIVSYKYCERSHFHWRWAKEFDLKLREAESALGIDEYDRKLEEHYNEYPWVSSVPLKWLWVGLHFLIAVIGIVLFTISLRN